MWNQVLTFSNYKLLDIDAPKQETIDDDIEPSEEYQEQPSSEHFEK